MQAMLFFKMLQKGRVLSHRKSYRNYYELLRVSAFPHVDREQKQEISKFFWDQALTPLEIEEREAFKERTQAKAVVSYTPPENALSFFRDTARGMNGIRR